MTILTSPLNLIVDFLFVDILNAPTTNPIPQGVHHSPIQSNENTKRSVSRGTTRETLRLGTFREVPSTIRTTHSLLTNSVQKQLEATQKRLTVARQTHASLRSKRTVTLRMNPQPSRLHRLQIEKLASNNLKENLSPDDPENLLFHFSEELHNHWTQIKRIQDKDNFEKIWR